jgi:hypothetical protein
LPRRFFSDIGGVGAGVYDPLMEMGYDPVRQKGLFSAAG